MKTTIITVHAGRVFNHPYEQYSNLRPEVHMTASLDEGDDPIQVTRQLQATAETLVEDHKRAMLTSLEQLESMRVAEQELQTLGSTIRRAQSRVDQLRGQHPELTLHSSDNAY